MKTFRKAPVITFILVLLFSIFSVNAQEYEDDEWYMDRPITQINYEGLKTIKKAELSGLSSSYIGKTVSDSINDLMDRLYALELFDDIIPAASHDKADGVVLTFTVTEKPVVSAILFKGNHQVRNAPLRDVISTKINDIFTESNAISDERAIRNCYLEKGYTNVKVSYSTEMTEEGVVVTYQIREGKTSVITEINFEGNKIFKDKVLKKQLKLKEVGLIHDGAFQEAILENDRQAILKYYADRGYVDAQILNIDRTIVQNEKKNRAEMHITFYISEGVQYKFDGISFNGNSIFTTKQLSDKVKLKKGDIYNRTKYYESLAGVQDLYYENGYTANGFVPSENKNALDRTISITVNIVERDRSHVESVVVRGNQKTKDYVITRELPIQSGDVFSKTKLTSGLRNLYNLQYFSSVVPDVQAGSEPNLLNLIINVEEQMTNSLEFGLTFSGVTDPTQLPFALFAKWSNSNLGGTGRTLSASTTISSGEQSVSLGYSQGWLFGLPIELNESLSFSHSKATALKLKVFPDGTINNEDYYMQYDSWTTSLNSSVGRRFTYDWAIFTVSGGLSNVLKNYIYDETLYTPVDSQIKEYANKLGLINSLWVKASLDGRDINYDPSKGWYVSETISWFGLTPWETDFYARFDTKLEGYLTLLNIPITEKYTFKMILAAQSQLYLQIPAPGSGVSDSNKLYIDGMFAGRGWTTIYNSTKGRAMWNNSLELRFPVVPGIIAVDAFFDVCALTPKVEDMFGGLNNNHIYYSFGPDIRILMPQFPMRFMFCNTFKINEKGVDWRDTMKFVLSFNIVNK